MEKIMESVRHLLHHFEPHIKVLSMSKITLRPYQIQLKADIYNAWNSGAVNVLAVSPTGSGKAMTLCTLAEELAYTYGIPTVIKVHRRELVSQLCGTLAQLGIPHNVIAQRSNILEIIEEEKRLHGKSFYEPRAPITVVSVDTLLSRAEKYAEFCQRQRVWILDEAAHQLKDNKWGKAAALFPNAIGVGFTATPQRLDKKGLGRHAFGLFDVMVQGPTVRWLIDNGFLSKFKIVVPKSDYLDHLEDDGNSTKDFTQKARIIASRESHIVGDVVKAYKEYIFGKQAILFADCIDAAKKMEEQFNAHGIPAKLLTGETPSKERLQGVIGYRDGKIKVLLNVDLFDEGFDVPGTDAVIMARPTKSLGKYLQMCGRALRVAKGKEFAYIIDHVGNCYSKHKRGAQHGLPDKIRQWTLDNIVRKRDTVSLHRFCMNEMCNLPFDRWLDACPYCGNTDKPYRRNVSEVSAREALKIVDGDMELLDPETIRELENEINLENPFDVEERVKRTAGEYAGKAARKKQQERIEMQKTLAETIARWAGREKRNGFTDRQIKKRFMMKFSEGITVALSLPKAEMQEINTMIKQDLGEV